MTLAQLLHRPKLTHEDLKKHLDGLAHQQRLEETTALNKKEQERLWDVAGTLNKSIDLDFLVPQDAAALEPFPFVGKNSLPAFKRFRKIFYRANDGTIGGYNNQTLEKVTGPGYYVAEASPGAPGPVVVNYLRTPSEKPSGWPEIRPNEEGLSRFVYAGMKDYLRYVSDQVLIGRAFRADGDQIIPLPNWFVLCRQTP